MKGARLIVFNSISSFFAISTAGFLNAYLMRQTELTTGIDVVDPANPSMAVGKSQAAASKAVLETSISRFILAIPILLPATGLYLIERARLMPSSFALLTLLQMSLFFGEMYVAVPLGIAFYP